MAAAPTVQPNAPLRLWIRRSGYAADTAINFDFLANTTVAEVLVAAHKVLMQPSFDTPQNVELAFNGTTLSNLKTIAEALPTTVLVSAQMSAAAAGMFDKDPAASQLVLELRRRFRRTTAPAVARGGQPAAYSSGADATLRGRARHRTPSPVRGGGSRNTTPKRAARDSVSPSARSDHDQPANNSTICLFQAQWNSPLCAACGGHRRAHERFPLDRVELQDRLVRSASKSPGPGHRAQTPRKPLWTPRKRSMSPERPRGVACAHFRAQWNREGACSTCGHLEKDHHSQMTPRKRHESPGGGSTARRRDNGSSTPRPVRPPAGFMAPTATTLQRTEVTSNMTSADATPLSPSGRAARDTVAAVDKSTPQRNVFDLATHRQTPPATSSAKRTATPTSAAPTATSRRRSIMSLRTTMDDTESDEDGETVAGARHVSVSQAQLLPYTSDPTAPDPCHDHSHRKRVCNAFAPLWNHNNYCAKCYNPFADHVEDIRKRKSRRERLDQEAAVRAMMLSGISSAVAAHGNKFVVRSRASGAATTGEETIARFHALPWHYILTYCAVEDLLTTAKSTRALTLAARPLLRSTMSVVMSYPPPTAGADFRDSIVDLAEVLSTEPVIPLAESLIQLLMAILHTYSRDADRAHLANAKIGTLSEGVTLLRQVASLNPRPTAKLPNNFGAALSKAEGLQAALGRSAPDTALVAAPLLHFASALWHHQRIQNCASRYLAYDQIPV
jgi:hypothetical protein